MKKILIATLALTLLSVTWIGQTTRQTKTVIVATPTLAITDPQLVEAWNILNSLDQHIEYENGKTISGHNLAQYALNNNVQIVWDETNECSGNSCSKRYHDHGSAVYTHDGKPIYVRVELKASDKQTELIETIAHEIYHYTEPYGQVDDTLYEEYLAFNLSARIADTTGMADPCSNPLKLTELKQWMENHHILYGYTNLQPYPVSLSGSVDTSVPSSTPVVEETTSIVVTLAPSTANPACTINALGLPDCQ